MSITRIPSLLAKGSNLKAKEYLVRSHLDRGKILYQASCIDGTDDSTVNSICKASYLGFKEWSARSLQERAEVLDKATKILFEKKKILVDSHLEIGGPPWFANFNVDGAIDQIKQYITCTLTPEDGQVLRSNASALALSFKRPIGPVLSIAPWNAPVILGCRAIAAPLAAGCSVLLKSSEKSPHVSHLLVQSFHEAGVPLEALQLVNVTSEDSPTFTDKVLANDAIRMVNFTGSTNVGRQIAVTAASHLKPALLELGGKNCIIVEPDADLEKCVPTVLQNSWWHQGQICMSSDKVYVHSEIYDQFIKKCLSFGKIEVESNPDLKIPLRDEAVSKKVNQLVKDAISKGATVVFGEYSKEFSEDHISPLVLAGVTPEMEIFSEETFGPIMCIFKYDNTEATIDDINLSKQGLKSAVWSSNTLKAIEMSKRIQCGGVHINRSCIHDEPSIPHGGVKSSGQGRFNGTWGLDLFSIVQAITVD